MTKATLLLLLLGACAALPPSQRPGTPAPVITTPPAGVSVCWLETGGTTVDGSYGAGGQVRAARWAVTTSALLVRHPKGTWLIDTGISPRAQDEAKELRGWARFVFDQTAGRNALTRPLDAQLRELGVSRLDGVIVSHSHPDHLGGIASVPDVPLWVGAPELELLEREAATPTGAVMPAQARAAVGRLHAVPFEASPYAGYDRHWDVFGDGTLVVVPTYGHTPGSVATFVSLGPTRRFVHVGDLINLRESLDRQVPKSALMRWLTDADDARTQAQVRALLDLHQADPGLFVLPAHDRPAWEELFGASADLAQPPPCVSTP